MRIIFTKILVFIFCAISPLLKAQLTFNNGLTAQQLAQSLAGPGVVISNATINCASNAIGSFTGTSNLGITTGIVLTSGSTSIISPNTNAPDAGVCNNTPGDNQVDNNSFDACALEFDVVPLCDTIRFKYVFGSEEYPEFVNQGVSDAFAFYISGPGITGQPNIALIPGTSTPVSIDNLNAGNHSQFYVPNSGTTIEYDAFTTVLTAWSVVQPCQTYHMKIVIVDEGDCIYDSGVFLQAGSLVCHTDFSASAVVQDAMEGCQNGSFQFCRTGDTTLTASINYTIAGSAINGVDYNTIPTSINFPAGQRCASLPIVAIEDHVYEGTDSILLIYQPGPCPVMDTVKIYITDNRLDAGPNDTICSGSSTTIGTTPENGVTYSWHPVQGLSSSTSANPTVTLTNPGTTMITINYILTADHNGCLVSDTVAVSVYPPTSANAGNDQTLCATTVQLNGTVGGAATNGTWTGGAGTFNPNANSLNTIYTPTAGEFNTGSVTLTLTTNNPFGCGTATDQVVITLNSPSTVSAGPDQNICIDNDVILTGSFGGAATGGIWSGGNGTFVPDNTSPTAIYTPSAGEISDGSATLIYSASNPNSQCAAVRDTMNITIYLKPTANAGSSQWVCKGSSATLGGTIGGTATSGSWSGGTGTFSPNSSTLNATYTPSAAEYAADSVLLTLTTDDPAGPCSASLSNMVIRFYESPDVHFSASDSAGCPIFCTNFFDASTINSGSIVSWLWDFGDGSNGSTQPNPSNCYTTSGFYDVKLIVTSDNGCVNSYTQTHFIDVYNIPVAEYNTSPNPASLLDPAIQFNNLSSSDVTYWNWDFGDGNSLAPSTSNPSHSYADTANTYTTTLIVHNADGCYDTISHQVIIGPAFSFYIPNSFTPNNDGINDFFFGSGIGIDQYDLWIFDRWGNLIFHTKDLSEGWNGKAKGGSQVAQIDVYVWKVAIKDVLGTNHSFLGTVTISR